ncbi:hypothetical protein QIS99_13455 [Streptomyces sp. B-S-A8]|uniref:PIN domain-containing protein n=1 Tax=Streptomyces solicavernae TaxID=3043614 RepID=A0ABT6RS06_9ACTN|nr:hypothetical protein [Streptomyces sp. B-S-A8]MDI3387199.1 hypothetical protein [Streptomyces sp. B-S-A8]
MTVVYDAGMLIRLEQGRGRAQALHRRVLERGGHRPVVPLPVLGQVWRPGPGNYTNLKPILAGCTVYAARDSRPPHFGAKGWDDPRHACLPCASGHTEQDGKRVGALASRVKLPAKKSFDVVDALVLVIAAHHGRALVVTTDIEDILAYREALGEHQIGVCHPDQPDRIL